jgi:hypothetical protein
VDGTLGQPPAAPLILILGDDGWFSQTALPAGRKSPGKPLAQYTVDDYVASFSNVAAARGTYSVNGNVLTRKHVASIDPNAIGWEQKSTFTVQSDTLTFVGANRTGQKVEATFRKLKAVDTITR